MSCFYMLILFTERHQYIDSLYANYILVCTSMLIDYIFLVCISIFFTERWHLFLL
uniref:Uncharacterized protein n=1 Tax=Arundo donax TaxID=35708 RepID=A0A0A8ZEL7_ARUDO